jgi:hypothetical protein
MFISDKANRKQRNTVFILCSFDGSNEWRRACVRACVCVCVNNAFKFEES